jgi:hypothetical protein
VIYYANPSTSAVRSAMDAGRIGCITSPRQGNAVDFGRWDVIADNGCFSDRWDPARWEEWGASLPPVRFVVCPDVVGDHTSTIERWERWAPVIAGWGQTPAFVCQDGATPGTVADADVLFLGGSNAFKLGAEAWAICRRWRGSRWLHMGRVNSRRRLVTAASMGCRSVDGTFLAFGPDKNLPRLLGWLDHHHRHPMLWGQR